MSQASEAKFQPCKFIRLHTRRERATRNPISPPWDPGPGTKLRIELCNQSTCASAPGLMLCCAWRSIQTTPDQAQRAIPGSTQLSFSISQSRMQRRSGYVALEAAYTSEVVCEDCSLPALLSENMRHAKYATRDQEKSHTSYIHEMMTAVRLTGTGTAYL